MTICPAEAWPSVSVRDIVGVAYTPREARAKRFLYQRAREAPDPLPELIGRWVTLVYRRALLE